MQLTLGAEGDFGQYAQDESAGGQELHETSGKFSHFCVSDPLLMMSRSV